ncbi:TonB-dependent siderophore receptor [Noviherbaspirillum sp. CPCC 100848]|uniref:TonB-dependent siderophore receptor n=1 Tax=Noviherbaspirillum album TaxID=3080276 RepID=A0ABU6JCT3_9BURK|nr:TonB-dependent siderophore receptor [Noviherbaspirillum sp. CPCC 100848]MEC4721248.1 TonB-dependent siderophore receptor [Noviherbaspirillum sp. CPCC 100848]
MQTPQFKKSSLSIAITLAFCGAAGVARAQTAEEASKGETVLPTVQVKASADASSAGLPAEYRGGQVARGGRLGLLGNIDIMDSPFSSTSYTQALIQDQQARSVGDVLQNDPGVRVARGFGNYQELYVIRGFPVNSDDLAYNGLYGLLPRQFVSTELLERVEVFRGANAFLNGAAPGGGGIGGMINLVPKRAPNEPLTQATAGIDSGGQKYIAADTARRFGPDGSTGIRINAAHRGGDTAIDDERRELNLFSVGVDHRSRDFRLSADAGYQNHKLDRARPSVDVADGVAVPSVPRASANYAQPWSYSDERDVFGTVRGEYDLTQDVIAWAAAGTRRGRENNSLANPEVFNAAGDTHAYRFDNARKDTVYTGELGIRAKLRTGSIGHTLSASASTFHAEERNAYALSTFNGITSNLYNPVASAPPPATAVLGGTLSDPLVTRKTRLSSVALADTLALAEGRLLVTLGARHQTIREDSYDYTTGAGTASYDESAVTPVAGVVFKASSKLSFYANYIEALSKGPVAGATARNAGQVFDPYRSRQKEIGVKYDAGNYGLSAALFTTSQPMGLLDPTTNLFGIDGEQKNRGLELSVYGAPARGLRLLGGVTLLDAKQERTGLGTTDGNDVIGVPDVQANLGAEWDVPGVRGLALNGRVVYTASQYADAANTQEVPAWTRLDAGVRYVTMFGKQAVTLRGQIENLANRRYWASAGGYPGAGYLVQGAPRTLVVSASLDF